MGAAALILVAIFALYRGTLRAPFVLDDLSSVQNNLSIRRLWPLENATIGGTRGRPLANASLALDYAVGDGGVAAFHRTNIAIHALAALLLFGLIRRTLRLPVLHGAWANSADLIGGSAALLWAVHPLQTEAVTYIAQRTEVLMALCYLLTLYCFVRAVGAQHSARVWLGLALIAAFAGVASKEVIATVPLTLLLFDRVFVSGSWRGALRARFTFYLALASIWVVLAVLMARNGARGVGLGLGISPFRYAVTECGVVMQYLKLAIWPRPLVFDYGTSINQSSFAMWCSILAMIAIGGAVIALLRTRPTVGFLAAWPLLILAPTSSIVPIALQPMAEHRMYLPLAGLTLAAVLLLWRALGTKAWMPVLLASLVLGGVTRRRNDTYTSAVALWSDTVEKSPDNDRAQLHLGVAYLNAGQPSEARVHLTRALALNPRNASAFINLGVLSIQTGQPGAALAHLEQAIRLEPHSAEAHYNLGWVLLQTGKARDGAKEFLEAIRLNPDHGDAHNNLGTVLAALGNHPAAIEHFTAALRVHPRDPEILANRAGSFEQLGQRAAAVADYQAALALRPDFTAVRSRLEALQAKAAK